MRPGRAAGPGRARSPAIKLHNEGSSRRSLRPASGWSKPWLLSRTAATRATRYSAWRRARTPATGVTPT
eukprot:109646-Lingulodinium_polyedra.AAC.1